MAIKQILLASLALTLTTVGIYYLMDNSESTNSNLQSFMTHQRKFNKRYSSKEEMKYRLSIYKNNLDMIRKHNSMGKSWKMGENQFTDLTFEEFQSSYLIEEPIKNTVTKDAVPNLECGNVDWRKKGKVSRVKDQGSCGSCWAFSTTGSLESAYAIFKDENLEFSEQELVDCTQPYGNYGCNGGYMNLAYDYILKSKITLEADYPYRGVDQNCKNPATVRHDIKSYNFIDPIDVNGLMTATTNQPVASLIEVTEDFMHYSSGIYTNNSSSCGKSLNHAILVVGFFVDTVNSYFIVKNSWAETWGENGYIRVKIGSGTGTCGLANKYDTYPVL